MVLDDRYLLLRLTRDGYDEERKAKEKGDIDHGCSRYHLHGVLEALNAVWCFTKRAFAMGTKLNTRKFGFGGVRMSLGYGPQKGANFGRPR